MKRKNIFVAVTCLLFLGMIGCSIRKDANTNKGYSDIGLKDEPVIWIQKPTLELDGILELYSHSYNLSIGTTVNEKLGYPQDWDSDLYKDKSIGQQAITYTDNAIIVKKDGKYGIYDYDGDQLLEPIYTSNIVEDDECPIQYYVLHGFGIITMLDQTTYSVPILASDFSSYSIESVGGLGGDYGYGYVKIDGKIGYFFDSFEEYPLNCDGFSCLVRIGDANHDPYDDGFQIGLAIYDGNSTYVADSPDFETTTLATIRNKYSVAFANGFYGLQNKQSSLIAIVDASIGKKITNYEFDEIKVFEEGYCPVKKNGKWAYIDVNGNEVTDYIFDDASTVYEGKVYVSIGNQQYGIIDLKSTLLQSIAINSSTINK